MIRAEKIRGLYLPWILIAIGLPTLFAVNWGWAEKSVSLFMKTGRDSLIYTGVYLAIALPCQWAAVLLMAKITGAEIGDLKPAVMKATAIGLFVEGVGGIARLKLAIVSWGLSEFTVGPIISLAIFWGLAAWLFDELDWQQIMVLFLLSMALPLLGAIVLLSIWLSLR